MTDLRWADEPTRTQRQSHDRWLLRRAADGNVLAVSWDSDMGCWCFAGTSIQVQRRPGDRWCPCDRNLQAVPAPSPPPGEAEWSVPARVLEPYVGELKWDKRGLLHSAVAEVWPVADGVAVRLLDEEGARRQGVFPSWESAADFFCLARAARMNIEEIAPILASRTGESDEAEPCGREI